MAVSSKVRGAFQPFKVLEAIHTREALFYLSTAGRGATGGLSAAVAARVFPEPSPYVRFTLAGGQAEVKL